MDSKGTRKGPDESNKPGSGKNKPVKPHKEPDRIIPEEVAVWQTKLVITFPTKLDKQFWSIAQKAPHLITFENNILEGHFYNMDAMPNLEIIDTPHTLNIANIIKKERASKIEISWNLGGTASRLSINNKPYAIFDFKNQVTYLDDIFITADYGSIRTPVRSITSLNISPPGATI